MTALTWQALLFLTAAYFAGCCLGCILRRIFWPPRVAVPEPVTHPVAATASQGAGAAATLQRSTVEARPHPVAQEPIRRVQPIEQAVVAEREAMAVTAPARKEEPRTERVVEARPPERQPAPIAAPVPRVEEKTAVVTSDDLKRIHLIDAAIESKLNALGVRRFAEIAQWTASDVARISKELGFKGRIQNENWIEQAQILAKGGETHYARRLARGEIVAARVVKDEGEPSPIAVARDKRPVSDSKPEVADRSAFAAERAAPREDRPAPVVPRDSAPSGPLPVGMARDNLQRIRGINAEIEALIGRQGVARYAQIASWTKADVDRFDQLLGQSGRIARENWIEQAQILTKGGDTSYSREVDRQAAGDAEAVKSARATDLSGLRSVRSEALRGADAGPREIGSAGRIGQVSDLKRIRGIGVSIEKKLHALGVTSYEDIAGWTQEDVDRFGQSLDLKDRIEQEHWVEQARMLVTGGRAAYPRDAGRRVESDAQAAGDVQGDPERAADLSGLRSVRSDALRGAEASDQSREIGAAGRVGTPSDLKRIRGIGVLIEKRLHSLGITSYGHIANWTSADIDRISQSLDFKGRIERENWVEQARILAAGGQTEFSRRFDRTGGQA